MQRNIMTTSSWTISRKFTVTILCPLFISLYFILSLPECSAAAAHLLAASSRRRRIPRAPSLPSDEDECRSDASSTIQALLDPSNPSITNYCFRSSSCLLSFQAGFADSLQKSNENFASDLSDGKILLTGVGTGAIIAVLLACGFPFDKENWGKFASTLRNKIREFQGKGSDTSGFQESESIRDPRRGFSDIDLAVRKVILQYYGVQSISASFEDGTGSRRRSVPKIDNTWALPKNAWQLCNSRVHLFVKKTDCSCVDFWTNRAQFLSNFRNNNELLSALTVALYAPNWYCHDSSSSGSSRPRLFSGNFAEPRRLRKFKGGEYCDGNHLNEFPNLFVDDSSYRKPLMDSKTVFISGCEVIDTSNVDACSRRIRTLRGEGKSSAKWKDEYEADGHGDRLDLMTSEDVFEAGEEIGDQYLGDVEKVIKHFVSY